LWRQCKGSIINLSFYSEKQHKATLTEKYIVTHTWSYISRHSHVSTGVNSQIIRQIPYFNYKYYETCQLSVFPKFSVIGCSISWNREVLLLSSYGTVVLVIFSHVNWFYYPTFYSTLAMHLFSQENSYTSPLCLRI
jgi:hypothetical protein